MTGYTHSTTVFCTSEVSPGTWVVTYVRTCSSAFRASLFTGHNAPEHHVRPSCTNSFLIGKKRGNGTKKVTDVSKKMWFSLHRFSKHSSCFNKYCGIPYTEFLSKSVGWSITYCQSLKYGLQWSMALTEPIWTDSALPNGITSCYCAAVKRIECADGNVFMLLSKFNCHWANFHEANVFSINFVKNPLPILMKIRQTV